PYRKNDTCYVEQKNWSIVRRQVGYGRYATDEALTVLNELYDVLRDYVNFFMPSMKLRDKTRDGARVTRRYHPAKTPYHRVLDSTEVKPWVKRALRARYARLNPAELKRRIERLQRRLEKLTARVSSKTAEPQDKDTESERAQDERLRRAG
ncbi:MAG: transposase, partial [Candidatus Hydrogenedentes bacterium]|nr:transposase [Candidatus Hydrogenedentota bacterium]